MPNFQVQGCSITKTEIVRALGLPNCDRIVFRLTLRNPNFLDLTVFAADSSNNKLPGSTVSWTALSPKNVHINSPFDPSYGSESRITLGMIQVLDFTTLQLTGKRYKPRNNKPPHGSRDFVGWKAKFIE